MPFVGIISKENDSNFIKNAISKNSKESNFEIININRKSIENVKNVKFDILVICENIEKEEYSHATYTNDAKIYGNQRGIQRLYSFLSLRGFL